MNAGLKPSRLNMWRAVIAMMHADFVVKPHEVNFILEGLRDLPLTEDQRALLFQDIKTPAPIEDVFQKISSPADKKDFFHLARAIAWSDGDFDEKEQAVLRRLSNVHFENMDSMTMVQSCSDFGSYLNKGDNDHIHSDPVVLDMIRKLVG